MTAFLHGKLPAQGDFVGRGLMPDARAALDDWLAASLADARSLLGERFAAAYDRAPPWLFAIEEDGRWTAGALAPSMDAVGRRYPLMLGLTDLDPEQVESAAALLDGLLYEALAADWDADRLHAAAEVVIPERGEAWQQEGWWGPGVEKTTLADARPVGLLAAMLSVGQAVA